MRTDEEREQAQKALSAHTQARTARIHGWLQGHGEITDEDRQWINGWEYLADLQTLVKLRDEHGQVPPSSTDQLDRARRFIAGDRFAFARNDGRDDAPREA